jgi:hypothetical protein
VRGFGWSYGPELGDGDVVAANNDGLAVGHTVQVLGEVGLGLVDIDPQHSSIIDQQVD